MEESTTETASIENNKTTALKLVIRGGTLAARIGETTEAQLISAMAQVGAGGSYLLKVRHAHQNTHRISGIKVGKRLGQQYCKLYVCTEDSILECELGPKPVHQNSPDTVALLTPVLGEMPPELVPLSPRQSGSRTIAEVLAKLREKHGGGILPAAAVIEEVGTHFKGKACSGFIGNLYRCGYLVRVSRTEARLGEKKETLSTQAKRGADKRKMIQPGSPIVQDQELVATARAAFGGNTFNGEELAEIVRRLVPSIGKRSLGGYLGGLRKRKVLQVSGSGKDRKYTIPDTPLKLKGPAQIPAIALQLKASADEYTTLRKRKEELQKELARVEERLKTLHESAALFEELRKVLI